MAWDPWFPWVTIVGVLARGENCTDLHLARLIAGVQKGGVDVHDIAHASGSADLLGYEVSPANAYCGEAGQRTSRMRSVATDGLFAPSYQRSGAQQSWSSLNASCRSAKDAQNKLHSFQSYVGSLRLASGQAFVSSFRWIPSELNYSDKRSRFFDRDYDPRNTSSFSCTAFDTVFSGTDMRPTLPFSPSQTYLDVDEVDPASHVHVPAVIVESHAPSGDLSSFTRHAEAVSSQWSSATEENDCIGGFGKQMYHRPFCFVDVLWATSRSGCIAISG